MQPREILLGSGRVVTYAQTSGGLGAVVLAGGGRHQFTSQAGVWGVSVAHILPGHTEPYTVTRDIRGNVVQVEDNTLTINELMRWSWNTLYNPQPGQNIPPPTLTEEGTL